VPASSLWLTGPADTVKTAPSSTLTPPLTCVDPHFWAPLVRPIASVCADLRKKAAAAAGPKAQFLKIQYRRRTGAAAPLQHSQAFRPCMVLRNGQEVTRINGALPAGEFMKWVYQQLG